MLVVTAMYSVVTTPVCHWCTIRLGRIEGRGTQRHAVGACEVCHVLACHGHGVYDFDADKFICVVSLERSLAKGSGAVAGLPDVNFPTIDAIGRRIPQLVPVLGEGSRPLTGDGDETYVREKLETLAKNPAFVNIPYLVAALKLARHLLSGSTVEPDQYYTVVGEEIAALLPPLDEGASPARRGEVTAL